MTGRVVLWAADKRYARILGYDRRRYFAPQSEFIDVLSFLPGQLVTFVPIESDKGMRAKEVRLLERA